ncbi:MAG: RadC family protein [Cellulosilyticaceae bacterium]
MKIVDQPLYTRPYEKFERHGVNSLTDVELLAILLRTGTKKHNVVELAHKLLCKKSKQTQLIALYELTLEELMELDGIGKIKGMQILALLELAKRISKQRYEIGAKFNNPRDISNLFMEELRHRREECFLTLLLDAKCRMITYELVSKGSLTASIVHPREVYKRAISKSAYSIVAIHNHPSGDPTPSKEDIQITTRLKQVGELVGIPLMDHIIIGDGSYISLKEQGCI